MPFTVAIVEDNADICAELEQILATSTEFRCVCACRNAESALHDIPSARPDLVIMDISLPDGTGIECTRQLKSTLPETQIVMFTVHDDPDRIFRALAAGASGYILKRVSAADLLNALRDVANGGVPMTGEIARRVIAAFRVETPVAPQHEKLTPREHMVLEKLAQGMADKEIGHELSITSGTVRLHLKQIYRKLHVRSRTEAVIEFLKNPNAKS